MLTALLIVLCILTIGLVLISPGGGSDELVGGGADQVSESLRGWRIARATLVVILALVAVLIII